MSNAVLTALLAGVVLTMVVNVAALVMSRRGDGRLQNLAFVSSVAGLISPSFVLFTLPLMLVWGLANEDSPLLIAAFCLSTAVCVISTGVSVFAWLRLSRSSGRQKT